LTEKFFIDVLGWIGVAAVLIAYVLVSLKKWPGDSLRYQSLNVLGAGLLIVNSAFYGAMPSVVVNVVWVGIAVVSVAVGRWQGKGKRP